MLATRQECSEFSLFA